MNHTPGSNTKYKDFIASLKDKPIIMYEKKHMTTQEELIRKYGDDYKFIVACDFHVADIHKGQEIKGGYKVEKIINIDHHAPTAKMESDITSTCLAMDYVRENGTVPSDGIVLINHADCDSILASLIVLGILPCDEKFKTASIEADHTGREDDIADLLQAFDFMDKDDIEFCVRNLELHLNGQRLEPEAESCCERRSEERKRVLALVKKIPDVQKKERVPLIETEEKVDITMLIPLLPHAHIVMTACPYEEDHTKWAIKLRRGLSASEGFSLNKISLPKEFGGRWDAYSNTRGKGSTIDPKVIQSTL